MSTYCAPGPMLELDVQGICAVGEHNPLQRRLGPLSALSLWVTGGNHAPDRVVPVFLKLKALRQVHLNDLLTCSACRGGSLSSADRVRGDGWVGEKGARGCCVGAILQAT